MRLLNDVEVATLEKKHVEAYLLWLIKKRGYSEGHVHTAVNALKFYFEQVEGRQREFYDLPRPKKPYKLPSVLAEEEVSALIQRTQNLKHRALLMTAYSAGLRVSELISLKISDIDSKRMMLHIREGKGKKDRMVPLSKSCFSPSGSTLSNTAQRFTFLKGKTALPIIPGMHRPS